MRSLRLKLELPQKYIILFDCSSYRCMFLRVHSSSLLDLRATVCWALLNTSTSAVCEADSPGAPCRHVVFRQAGNKHFCLAQNVKRAKSTHHHPPAREAVVVSVNTNASQSMWNVCLRLCCCCCGIVRLFSRSVGRNVREVHYSPCSTRLNSAFHPSANSR